MKKLQPVVQVDQDEIYLVAVHFTVLQNWRGRVPLVRLGGYQRWNWVTFCDPMTQFPHVWWLRLCD